MKAAARLPGAGRSTLCPKQNVGNMAARCISSNFSRNLKGSSTGTVPSSTLQAVRARQPLAVPRPRPFYGVALVIGKRREMEDAVRIAQGFTRTASEVASGHYYDFFAVYDGHGGVQVAHKCRDRMHMVMAEEVARRWGGPESEFVCWEDTMAESFRRVDAEVATKGEPMYDGIMSGLSETMGSTALIAVVSERRIVVANCGDSRAVLSRGGRAVALSSDHKPNRPDEMRRIEQAGGKVIDWNGFRVWGILATSRSIGDHYLKPCVTCEPEVTVTDRLGEDEFLILASDGLWDVVSNEMACKIVRNCLHGSSAPTSSSPTGGTPADVATLLTEIAISRGSRDNISVVVVQLIDFP
ncbi:Protein phosphatase 2C family protein [Rhynchospora pubera]|uniref:protein-serine/threonine phosphatase n=1 Tax=Rhynchospora pubera TaxID=906938 RepID=A0AAV8FMD0_9POAL|nr:Protein phosphatase 2C family protein [Rhynchospora pubera]